MVQPSVMDTKTTVMNPANLKAIGFSEYDEEGIKKYKRGKDIIWFTGSRSFTGNFYNKSSVEIFQEILKKEKDGI
ncbi:MAG: hypothetical protein JWO03_2402 [Bacteroidetes bacterium]|nr:hypothetical protein [Bacteroidota bacterium]